MEPKIKIKINNVVNLICSICLQKVSPNHRIFKKKLLQFWIYPKFKIKNKTIKLKNQTILFLKDKILKEV
jgi:hypothetical protein